MLLGLYEWYLLNCVGLVGVKFVIGQVGSSVAATKFLQDIKDDSRIQNVIFVASGKAGGAFPHFAALVSATSAKRK